MKFKKIVVLFLSMIMMGHMMPSMAAADMGDTCRGTLLSPCIVQDTYHNSPQLKRWRDNFQLATATVTAHGNAKGLTTLWMSGSAEPSVAGFTTIVDHINSATNNTVTSMVDVDLRKESHGFLNGNAVTLGITNNWINRYKTRQQALSDEQKWLHNMSQDKSVYVLRHQQFKKKALDAGQWVAVKSVHDEATIAAEHHMVYLRITVNDHMKPDDAEVDRFVDFVTHEKPHTWMYFHCRGGLGRTTTFMAMYDMLHNANQATFEEIIAREAAFPPQYDLLHIWRQHSLLTPYYQARALFIRQFYQFAKAHLQDPSIRWSTWIKNKK